MKKRTFYATFLLFLTAIYTSILSLSVITLKGTMQQARQQCLNEQYFIASAVPGYGSAGGQGSRITGRT